MATFALIHGGGSTAWDWHLVSPLLEDAGHDAVAVDLPIEDPSAQLDDYVGTVVAAVGDRPNVIVVGHSLGGFTAPLVCDALQADGLVYLSAMIPLPGESFGDWWTTTGHDRETIADDPDVLFFNGFPEDLANEARRRERDQSGAWMSGTWPAERHPDVPTRAILCLDDRFFPPSFMRRHVGERLGITPVEIPGGHYATLTHPAAVASALDAFAQEIAAT
jgi:pimeloyl-ACP methyl ester carboxylesterase